MPTPGTPVHLVTDSGCVEATTTEVDGWLRVDHGYASNCPYDPTWDPYTWHYPAEHPEAPASDS